MYRVRVKLPMDVGHFLVGDFDDESIPHRHTYRVEWRCDVERLDANGFSIDIALMKRVLEQIGGELEGTLLNDLPFFSDKQTSVEHFALYVEDRLRDLAPGVFDSVSGYEIRIWEDEIAWASVVRP